MVIWVCAWQYWDGYEVEWVTTIHLAQGQYSELGQQLQFQQLHQFVGQELAEQVNRKWYLQFTCHFLMQLSLWPLIGALL